VPLGGLLPYGDEEDQEFEVSPQFGDLTDLQEMGPDGDRDLDVNDDILARLAKKKMPVPQGLPQLGSTDGMERFMKPDPNTEALHAFMKGFRG
jgi:hypothetical protein